MSHIPRVMHAFARLLNYPDQRTSECAELLYVLLHGEIPDAASDLSQFGAFLEQHDSCQVEEAFTGTFDVNPTCALEVGWQLFGEEYTRGMFLVRMRQEMRKHDLPESAELPDHISHVLAVVAAMPEDEAAKFVRACVQPAVEKMDDAMTQKDTPYRHVISCLAKVIQRMWGKGNTHVRHNVLASDAAQLDLLHAFPVAEAPGGGSCNCSGSCDGPNIVSLDTTVSLADRQRSSSVAIPKDRP